jgi:NADH:ubiquinone oxidoreductase subunit 5 (subunit L)/multisubunit Na+/H+ antiporter MnhA subunit
VILQQHKSINNDIMLLIFVAIMAKSAQFPFHIWLIDTMESPTPVSALMHAGVINAGGFLLARMSPWYSQSFSMLLFIFVVGITTALLGKIFMSSQVDIKKRLAYSTMGQMGYMIMQCGLGCFTSAVFHLIAHGFFKSTLFLSSGGELNQNSIIANSQKNKTYKLLPMIFATAICFLGYLIVHMFYQQQQLDLIIWLFLACTLYEIFQQVMSHAKSFKIKLIVAFIFIMIFFLYLMHVRTLFLLFFHYYNCILKINCLRFTIC